MSNVDFTLLKKSFSHLAALDNAEDSKSVAKNIRKHLKLKFPNIKFSVRSSFGKITVDWTDGAPQSKVSQALKCFESGSFNGMEDCFDFSKDNFNEIFGGVKFIQTYRTYTDEKLNEAIEAVRTETNSQDCEVLNLGMWNTGELIGHFPQGREESFQELIRAELNK